METIRDTKSDLILPVIFMGTTGGAFWAVARMSGEGCGWTNGLMWGLAWHYLSVAQGNASRRPFGSAWLVLAMVVGMYFGGMHGYGQFHSWVTSVFHVDAKADKVISINPLIGYWWNLLCGLGWGGVAAVCVVWSESDRRYPWWAWAARLGLVIATAWAARTLAVLRPDLIMPLYDRVNYFDASSCPDCVRTLRTLEESMMWIGFYLGGIIFEAAWRNYRNLAFIIVMGVGFGGAFIAFQWFHTLPNAPDTQIGWWKYWETSVGVLGGCVLGLCYLLFNRPKSAPSSSAMYAETATQQSRAAWLLGVWLPVLVSFYKVIVNESPRIIRAIGGDAERIGPYVPASAMVALLAVGVYVLCREFVIPRQDGVKRMTASMFVVPYVAMFLMSYIPQFAKAKVWENWALPIQLLMYAVLFLMGLASLAVIAARAKDVPSSA